MAAKKPRRHPWREHIETLTGAIVLALLFKAFLIEISRIPSPSMEPTLMGSPGIGLSDRVLVDKLSYRFRDPLRWEIVVFKHPLERPRNMVKRVVGLPGEEIRIEHGDLWVRSDPSAPWKIPSRSRAVQREMFLSVDFDEPRTTSWRVREGGAGWQISGRAIAARGTGIARFRPDDASIVDAADHGRPDSIRPRYPISGIGAPVGDLRVSAEVSALPDCLAVSAHIVEGDRLYRFTIPGPAAPADSAPRIEVWSEAVFRAGGGAPLSQAAGIPYRLRAGSDVEIGAQNLDDILSLEIEDEWVVELPVEPLSSAPAGQTSVELAQEGGGADLGDVQVYRDIYYVPLPTGTEPAAIPAEHYYMLGDNTRGSADSREWHSVLYSVAQGSPGDPPVEVLGNERMNPVQAFDREGLPIRIFRDVWGERHVLSSRQSYLRRDHAPSVPRELIQGRALATFWPIKLGLKIWRLGWLR